MGHIGKSIVARRVAETDRRKGRATMSKTTVTSNLPQTMRGMVLTGHGGLDRLSWRDDLPLSTPGPGEVLIRVAA